MNYSRLAADLVVIVHAGFIAFVLVGLLLVWIGIAARWEWIRNPWFRGVHLLAIAFVVLQAYLGIVCPLTEWENALRVRGGQQAYGETGFIQHWLHALIFFSAPPWVFTLCYTLFGLLVIGTLLLAPPRFGWRRQESPHLPAPH